MIKKLADGNEPDSKMLGHGVDDLEWDLQAMYMRRRAKILLVPVALRRAMSRPPSTTWMTTVTWC